MQISLTSRGEKRKRAPIVSGPQPVCGICKTQFSKYTCPRCNLPYCSLPCFRNSEHSACSESFDVTSLREDIRSDKAKGDEEKNAMLEILRRFEEQSRENEEQWLDHEGDTESEVSDSEEDLEKKIQGLNLDELSLEVLSEKQREMFLEALANPGKMNSLLNEDFENSIPWWESAEEQRPDIVTTPLPTLKESMSHELIYNIIAVLLAYAFTLRTYSAESLQSVSASSDDRILIFETMQKIIPLLFEPVPLVLPDIGGALNYIVSREETISTEMTTLMLHDTSKLLESTSVLVLSQDPLESHHQQHPIRALSDIHHFLSQKSKQDAKSRKFAARKILFYLAFLTDKKSPATSDPGMMQRIRGRISFEADLRDKIQQETPAPPQPRLPPGASFTPPKIVEI